MNSDWLDSYLVFSEELNFTNAAKALHISQPALHVKIAKLSDYIGKPLYHKVGRNLVLTPEGEDLRGFAREQASRSNSFLKQVRGESVENKVSLVAGEGTYRYLIGDVLSKYLKQTRNEIAIQLGDAEQVVSSVVSGRAHIGITPSVHRHEMLRYHSFYTVRQVLVLPKQHPLKKKRLISLKDLNETELIVPPSGKPHRIMIDRMLMDADVNWTPVIEVNGWDLMINFVKLRLGLAIVNSYCSLPKDLEARPLVGFPKIQFYVVERKSSVKYDAAESLKKMLLTHVNEEAL